MRVTDAGMLTASSNPTNVPSTTVNTKGPYTQLVASTAYDTHALIFTCAHDAVGSTQSQLVDIAVGAAASEQIVIPDVLVSFDQWNGRAFVSVPFPVYIPAGSRIAAQFQSTSAAQDLRIGLHLLNLGLGAPPGRKMVSYGKNTADSGGVDVDPGGTANTKGSWVQITASTNEDLKGLIVCIGNQALTKTSTCFALLDVGVGAGGSEQVIIPNIALGVDTNNEQYQPIMTAMFPINIPAGSRLAVRAQNSINTATVRKFDVVLLGVS